MNNEEKPNTTEVLQHVQKECPENIVFSMNDTRYLVAVQPLKLLAWNSVPDVIKDENSDEAKKHQTFRLGLKALLRPLLSDMLKKIVGRDVRIEPRLNILSWVPNFLIHFFINAIASKEWRIHVQACEECGEGVYRVLWISPVSNNISTTPVLPAAQPGPASSEHLQGRGQQDTFRAEDHSLSGGPVGDSGREEIRQEHTST